MRRILSVLLLLVAGIMLRAQDFTRLDWNILRIDSVLPYYTEVVPLDDDYASYHYEAVILYPELQPLTSEENHKLALLCDSLPEMPLVTTRIGISRKKGYLDLSFLPLVCREGKYYKILSCRIEIRRKSLARNVRKAASEQRYASSSVLSSGRWVKIHVQKNGVYMLTADDLRRMGFSDPSRVHLYGYGGHLQNELIQADTDYDDLVEVPLCQGKHGLLFYANGLTYWTDPKYHSSAKTDVSQHVTNHYARYAGYFLTEGAPREDAENEISTSAISEVVTDFQSYTLYERDAFAWLNSGRRLFDSYDYYFGSVQNYELEAPGMIAGRDAALRVVFTAAAPAKTLVETRVNGEDMLSFSINALAGYDYGASSERTFSIGNYISDNGPVQVRLAATRGHNARLDFMELNYRRKLELDGPFLEFRGDSESPVEFQISNPDARNIQVWHLGTPARPMTILQGEMKNEAYHVRVPRAADHYVAVDLYAEFPKPQFAGEIANQNLHGIDTLVDMVIIVPESGKLMAQARRLADAHARMDGLKVLTVRADEIYNEFSSGTPDATAYRRFMKMLYDRAPSAEEAPRYLLLFGGGAWDNRMYSAAWKNDTPEDYLLCFESDNSFSHVASYVMEDYFGLLDDGEGASLMTDKVDLGIGRFPVVTEDEARVLVDKTISYMENREAGGWKNTVVFLGDDGDDNLHMEQAERVATDFEQSNPQYDVRRIYWDAYPAERASVGNRYPDVERLIEKQMREGALVMNYTGHANPTSFSHEYVMRIEDFNKFTSPRIPLWVTAACDVVPFDMRTDNIGMSAMLNQKAAAVAFYGTTRTVYATDNLRMHRYFTHYLFDSDTQGNRYRLGDAVRLSKVSLIDPEGGPGMGTDLTQNKLHYVLMGDPALMIGGAQYRVVVDSINGIRLDDSKSGEALPSLAAGTLARVSGHIETLSGEHVPSFTGTLNSMIYDSKYEVTCFNNAGASQPFRFTTRDKLIYSGRDSLRAGNFTTTFSVPMDIRYSDENGRMVFYAVSDDRRLEANGFTESFLIGGSGNEFQDDKSGPEIKVWLNDYENPQGIRLPGSFLFRASLKDMSGINTSGNGIGHDLDLIIDGNPLTTYNLNAYYVSEFGDFTEGVVSFMVPELPAGKHRLEFRAWDAMNNLSTVTYDIEVVSGLAPQLAHVFATRNPASTTTTFQLVYDRPDSPCDFTIEVLDFNGKVLWQHTENGSSNLGYYSIPWNLTSSGGARLMSGVYLYRAVVTSEDGARSVTKANKIIILNNK